MSCIIEGGIYAYVHLSVHASVCPYFHPEPLIGSEMGEGQIDRWTNGQTERHTDSPCIKQDIAHFGPRLKKGKKAYLLNLPSTTGLAEVGRWDYAIVKQSPKATQAYKISILSKARKGGR